MLLDDDQTALLKDYVSKELANISEADPMVLGDYVMALLMHDKDDHALYNLCIEQLEDFLADQTTEFVNRLFRYLRSVGLLKSGSDGPGQELPLQHSSELDVDGETPGLDTINSTIDHTDTVHPPIGLQLEDNTPLAPTSRPMQSSSRDQSSHYHPRDHHHHHRDRSDRDSDRRRTRDRGIERVEDDGSADTPRHSRSSRKDDNATAASTTVQDDHSEDKKRAATTTTGTDRSSKRQKVDRPPSHARGNGSPPHDRRRNTSRTEKPSSRQANNEKTKTRRPTGNGDARQRPPPRDIDDNQFDPGNIMPDEMGGPHSQFIGHPDRRMMNRIGPMPRPFMPEGYDPERAYGLPKPYMGGPMMPPFMGDQGMMGDPMQFRPGAFPMDGGPPGNNNVRGAGRGRGGSWRPPHTHHDSTNSTDTPKPDQKTIVVESIPPEKCSMDSINSYFKKFGTITNIQINSKAQRAVVEFSAHSEAQKAHASPEAIFDNRFVRVHWQEGTNPTGVVPPGHFHPMHQVPPHHDPFFAQRGFGGPMRGIRGRGGGPRSHAVAIRPPPPGGLLKGGPGTTSTTTTTAATSGTKDADAKGESKVDDSPTKISVAPALGTPSTNMTSTGGGVISRKISTVPPSGTTTSTTTTPNPSTTSTTTTTTAAGKRQLLQFQKEQQNLLGTQISKQKAYMTKLEDMNKARGEGHITQEQFEKDKAVLMKGIKTLQAMIEQTKKTAMKMSGLGSVGGAAGYGVHGHGQSKEGHVSGGAATPTMTTTTTTSTTEQEVDDIISGDTITFTSTTSAPRHDTVNGDLQNSKGRTSVEAASS